VTAEQIDIATILAQLGDAQPVITSKVYAHLFQESDAVATDAIIAALDANPVPKAS
jgi:hypothetical protein